MADNTGAGPKHPATFPDVVLDAVDAVLGRWFGDDAAGLRILDPFAGVGGVHKLGRWGETVGVEIEPEWANQHPNTIVGDATKLPFDDEWFDAVVTSPAYGNRMADAYDGRDGSKRRTYRLSLGRPLSDNNAAGMQWGDAYRSTHEAAWRECFRVLIPHGLIVVNVSDHIRKGERVGVVGWHRSALTRTGFEIVEVLDVPTRRFRFGANRDARTNEVLLVGKKPGAFA